ncbi:hypothetical protein PRO82_001941 [Candidatus Protochlamydia amoebophila]|nr:hypothetical protein [Candidatus Protochlamydia amoebophila]
MLREGRRELLQITDPGFFNQKKTIEIILISNFVKGNKLGHVVILLF